MRYRRKPRVVVEGVDLQVWADDETIVVGLADPVVAAAIDRDDYTTNGVWIGGSPKKGSR